MSERKDRKMWMALRAAIQMGGAWLSPERHAESEPLRVACFDWGSAHVCLPLIFLKRSGPRAADAGSPPEAPSGGFHNGNHG
jgi:hypothetical protein